MYDPWSQLLSGRLRQILGLETSETNLMDSGDFNTVAAAAAVQWSHVMPGLPLPPSIVVSCSPLLTNIIIITAHHWSIDHHISSPSPFVVSIVTNTLALSQSVVFPCLLTNTDLDWSQLITTDHHQHQWRTPTCAFPSIVVSPCLLLTRVINQLLVITVKLFWTSTFHICTF